MQTKHEIAWERGPILIEILIKECEDLDTDWIIVLLQLQVQCSLSSVNPEIVIIFYFDRF